MICVPLQNPTLAQFESAQLQGDLVELWFDNLPLEEIPAFFAKKTRPFLYKHQGSAEHLAFLADFPLDYIDFDHQTAPAVIEKWRKTQPQCQIIISYHNFQNTPPSAELQALIADIELQKPDVIKIATTAENLIDSFRLFHLLETSTSPLICLAMGQSGHITRSAGHIFGNYLTFAPLDAASATAPGQIPIAELKNLIINC